MMDELYKKLDFYEMMLCDKNALYVNHGYLATHLGYDNSTIRPPFNKSFNFPTLSDINCIYVSQKLSVGPNAYKRTFVPLDKARIYANYVINEKRIVNNKERTIRIAKKLLQKWEVIEKMVSHSYEPKTTTLVTNKDKIKEQEEYMRDYILSQTDDKYAEYIQNCQSPWNKAEVIRSFFDKMNFKDIITVPVVYGKRNKIRYTLWYAISSLVDLVGGRVDDLKIKLLKGFEFLSIPQLKEKIRTPLFAVYDEIIIPDHLNKENDPRRNDRLFVNHQAIMVLIRKKASSKNPIWLDKQRTIDGRIEANKLLESLDSLDELISTMIDDLNEIIAEYRRKDELREIEEAKRNNQLLIEYQQREQEMLLQQERIYAERKELIEEKYQDVALEKNHIAYIFSSPEYLEKYPPKIKFGVSDTPQKRLRTHQTSCPTGKFYMKLSTYNSIASEKSIKMMLDSLLLKYKPNGSSADEWYDISSLDSAKEILKRVVNHTNEEYEYVMMEQKKIRELLL